LLDQHGSTVYYGNNLMVPLDKAVLYVRPLYVTSSSNPLPQLKYVVVVFNQQVAIEPTLSGALADVFGGSNSPTPPTDQVHTAAWWLQKASNDYAAAQAALAKGDLGTYQKDIEAMYQSVQQAQKAK
jgi:uncharacterized membrane protein (UPF0182 family)